MNMKRDDDDAVVAEIRAVRQELSQRFGENFAALCDFLVEQEKQHANRLVSRPANSVQLVTRVSAAK